MSSIGAQAGPTQCDWPTFGHDPQRSGATDCSTLNRLNVATLHPKWVFNTKAPVTAEPAIANGVAYVGAADGTFYAINAADGSEKWRFSNTDTNTTSYGVFTSSAAVSKVAGVSVVVVGGASTLYVLNADTGALLAKQCLDPRTDPAVRCHGSTDIIETESSPAVITHGNTAQIYLGMDYNESGPGRAGMFRFTLASFGSTWSLNPDWKFDPEALSTYTTNIFSQGGAGQGCGGVWGSPTIANGLVFFGTSNCATNRYVNPSLYGGESVFAISADTGALAWCYSPRPVNDLDEDFGATSNVLSTGPQGTVGIGGKDGSYYSFDMSANQPATTDPARACRGSNGQSPRWSTQVSTGGNVNGIIGSPAVGSVQGRTAVFTTNAIPNPDPATTSPTQLATLHAIDARTGAVLWTAPNVAPAYSGPSYANGLVFVPTTFGMQFTIYDADLGIPLWSFPLLAPSGPPAIAGDSIYIGSGVEPGPGTPVLSSAGALWAFSSL